jgi:hypothetical protein
MYRVSACLQAKFRVLEDLYMTKDEKRQSNEDNRKAEENLELTTEAT